ncbi:MAG: lipid-A-disaccharide synthase [Gammaproteobacteria bacterium]|jgi:lipid-A-disaccharide synthase|nr:lipid-A-disaccharide synthase [Gammaproteobacteria bacterium]MBU0770540.1 lipid-A-disaccharide synthase [Gammaproteobacteria bacterium]MBU0857497.1 lipid-A-disaccharide synthase [Gammaproteobacteria bacterium]MBU1845211.1 lipid-A-disaccharide synthase [Gammaproteobacteria bacterium]
MASRITVAMVAGEASGDQLAAHLMKALRSARPDIDFVGIGGPRMASAGLDAWWPAEKLSVRGYVEVLRHYRELSGIRKRLLQRLLAARPAAFIGVDAPDFNLWLERNLRDAGIPAIHYVSPSIWAWRGGRIKGIARSVSRMLCLFPFEPELYEKAGVPVSYVGHPFADEISPAPQRQAARERLALPASARVVALLPGSRQSELRYNAATWIDAARELHDRHPALRFLVPLTTRETRKLFEHALWERKATDLPISILFGHARDAMMACDAALVASGTATLEAALCRAPHVIAYRMHPVSWQIMKRMAYQPWVGLPNILEGSAVVPELLQHDATPLKLADALDALLGDEAARATQLEHFERIHTALRCDTASRAAAAILAHLPAAAP